MNGIGVIMRLIIFLFVFLISFVLPILAEWKIFEKAGEPGWTSLIPIYSSYMIYKIAWEPKYFFIQLGVSFTAVLLTIMNPPAIVLLIFVLAIALTSLVLQFLLCLQLASAFNHSSLFGIGLFFLELIFKLILAFDSSDYQGPQAAKIS